MDPDPTLPNGETYKKMDKKLSLADPANQARIADKLAAFTEGFEKLFKDYGNNSHAAAIRALEDYVEKLQAPAPAPGTCAK